MCIEIYAQDQYDNEFNSSSSTFETINMNIDYQAYTKIVHGYYYIRCILNSSPDGSSGQIQRRLFVTFQADFDNYSPSSLPIFCLIYGLENV